MDFQTCYAYDPAARKKDVVVKRRRIEPLQGLQTSWPLRRSLYQRLWAKQQARLKNLLLEINESTISQISTFVETTDPQPAPGRVSSAIILTGPSIASHALLFSQLSQRIGHTDQSVSIPLTSALAPNLKTLLKNLISKGTSSSAQSDDEDEVDAVRPTKKRMRLLNYDLQLLYDYVQEQNLSRVVVAFQDCEAFDGALLSDAIELLTRWQDRIPFVFFFGVATSIENFSVKLSKKATRCIQGQRFDVVKAESALEQVTEALYPLSESGSPRLWLGPGICSATLRRQREHIQSLDAFVDSAQYAYLSHFYANALSIFLDDSIKLADISTEHLEALRNLPSFQQHMEMLLEDGEASAPRRLLDSDEYLLEYLKLQTTVGSESLETILSTVEIIVVLQRRHYALHQQLKSNLLVDALAGQLRDSNFEKNLFMCLKKSNSEALLLTLEEMLPITSGDLHNTCSRLLKQLDKLQAQQTDGGALRSEQDVHNATLRTTVVAKKVELSKQKSTLTKGDAAYSEILNEFVEALKTHFDAVLIDPRALVFNEIFMYDLKSPHRDVFTPKPRGAIERALASPHDYLDCECCAPDVGTGEENTLASTQPSTAILYQLYLEGGALMNIADLRTAFVTILGDDQDEVLTRRHENLEAGHTDQRPSALFQRSLAELKYLGLVRGTRKKADHVMKISWKGV
ncbi:hypothetical protein E4T38_01930 [Aureobasidium subglaciale]|nr:hypothetical protein E4T38_01930 [Aureobasidium subglaciale]KAI5229273.1 hypothetical protein E4T40_01550 [Aureobasidium subglaciale]KAI5232931.1 hypothetical protein E4T41_01928 [Aureobasidium subglaciale]KAI5266379.1 hypothetical protein E4T46_01547 [Aureobasidium subglaciale]